MPCRFAVAYNAVIPASYEFFCFTFKRRKIKKRSEETQTPRAGCSKAEPKIFALPQTHSRGRGMAKI